MEKGEQPERADKTLRDLEEGVVESAFERARGSE